MLNVANLLPPAHVVRIAECGSPAELCSALVEPLVASDLVTDAEKFLADLQRREEQCTTVVDDGLVAIPHARSEAVRRLGLTVGLVAEPGVALHPDGTTMSRIFFCIAVPAFAPAAHLQLLQRLASFSRDSKRLQKLLSARTPAAAARCIHSFKG
jgi:mannitol/fructose-specific phosphotransferase system IIA component (Ntr-type)